MPLLLEHIKTLQSAQTLCFSFIWFIWCSVVQNVKEGYQWEYGWTYKNNVCWNMTWRNIQSWKNDKTSATGGCCKPRLQSTSMPFNIWIYKRCIDYTIEENVHAPVVENKSYLVYCLYKSGYMLFHNKWLQKGIDQLDKFCNKYNLKCILTDMKLMVFERKVN